MCGLFRKPSKSLLPTNIFQRQLEKRIDISSLLADQVLPRHRLYPVALLVPAKHHHIVRRARLLYESEKAGGGQRRNELLVMSHPR